ncbi:hypothetical protein AB0N38_04230 [Micromonospora aurantiaca]|uniref:hypothetical protein n=1 Tax=Micromonospora aurantiaca (nom. illeg.) TaxID=47850 RepID=UPI003442DB87
MTSTAAYALAAVFTAGPVVLLAPFAVARRSAETHADRTAAVIRDADRVAARWISEEEPVR